MKDFLFYLVLNIVLLVKGFASYDLTVIGVVKMADGIGRLSVELVNALKNDFSISLIPTVLNRNDVPTEVLKIIDRSSNELGDVVIFQDPIGDRSRFFSFFRKYPDKIKIAYSMFESTAIPDKWVFRINNVFDAVVVPDPFLVEVYKNSGVTVPIFVIPLGLDLSTFLNEPVKKTKNDPFVFANFSAYGIRKNQKTLVRAFYKAFGNDPSVKLWINGRYSEGDCFEKIKKEVESLEVSNITITKYCFNKEEYLGNFKKIDCYVSLSKGEGFSIQPREAMTLGIPVILSDNTAQTCICRSNLVKKIRSSIATPSSLLNNPFGFQYEIDDENEVVEALIQIKSDYESKLKKSLLMRAWAAQYDYPQLYPFYRSLVKPKDVFLGDENVITEDYLMTTSEELYRKYKDIIH